ncbi:glycosyltransferase family 4 protein [Candidatus Peregrinibacteria bacterium]|nr:glycosyltransferase family 4 protein [Candidatus Peregrinibacteria bacterium]
MKIAVDFREASRLNKTGKGWYAYNLLAAVLAQDSQNEYIFYIDKLCALPEEFKKFSNIAWRRINRRSIFWHLAVLRDLKAAHGSAPADLFFATTSFIIPALAARTLKTIIIVHDLVAFLFPDHNKKAVFIEKMTLKFALKKAVKVITISENTKKDLLKKFAPSTSSLIDKIASVPAAASEKFHQMSLPEIKNFRISHNLPERFILGVGTLEPRKNFTTLIDAFAQVNQEFPNLKLIIIGAKGWKYKQIFDRVHHQDIKDKVIFRGYVAENDLVGYYNGAEIFVFPSLYEGFGIPPLEAMKCSCPIIASNAASMPEVIGTGGLLVDPADTRGLAEAIKSILVDRDLRNKLVNRGQHQSQKFSWQSSASKLIQLFRSIAR